LEQRVKGNRPTISRVPSGAENGHDGIGSEGCWLWPQTEALSPWSFPGKWENFKILLTKKNVSIKSKNLYKGGQAVTLIVSTGFVS
jgi:hypothetical protein